ARRLKFSLPMQGGKGYSLTLREPRQQPKLCSLLKEGRVAVTPMGSSLRVAGTMEICGEDLSINTRRLRGVVESFCRFFPEFDPSDFDGIEPWAGLRPCSPDGLPYLGKVEGYENLVFAAGHSMLGLSLGPITATLVREIIDDEPTSVPLEMLDPVRFA
ncbi:MAG: NAD(P)/FAD-dependent oxidoreductase, partial [Verrucomicrobiales bacterium]